MSALTVALGQIEVAPTFVATDSRARRVSVGDSIDMVTTFLEAVVDVMGGAPSLGYTLGTNNPLAFERVMELED